MFIREGVGTIIGVPDVAKTITWNGNARWGPWFDLGGNLTSPVAVVKSLNSQRIDIFGRGAVHQVSVFDQRRELVPLGVAGFPLGRRRNNP